MSFLFYIEMLDDIVLQDGYTPATSSVTFEIKDHVMSHMISHNYIPIYSGATLQSVQEFTTASAGIINFEAPLRYARYIYPFGGNPSAFNGVSGQPYWFHKGLTTSLKAPIGLGEAEFLWNGLSYRITLK